MSKERRNMYTFCLQCKKSVKGFLLLVGAWLFFTFCKILINSMVYWG